MENEIMCDCCYFHCFVIYYIYIYINYIHCDVHQIWLVPMMGYRERRKQGPPPLVGAQGKEQFPLSKIER